MWKFCLSKITLGKKNNRTQIIKYLELSLHFQMTLIFSEGRYEFDESFLELRFVICCSQFSDSLHTINWFALSILTDFSRELLIYIWLSSQESHLIELHWTVFQDPVFKRKSLNSVGGNINWFSHCVWKTVWKIFKKIRIELLYNPAILLLDIVQRKRKC